MADDEGTYHLATITQLQNPLLFVYPHVKIQAYVIDHAAEDDGDQHVKMADVDYGSIARNAGIWPFVMCEIIPQLPLPSSPPLHQFIEIGGIYRWDTEHGWPEIHPVTYWLPSSPPTV